MPTPEQIETITKHYLIALLWTMPGDDDCENPGDFIAIKDLPQKTIRKAKQDVIAFVDACGELFDKAIECHSDGYSKHLDDGSVEAAFGHDFAITRNGHGLGYWDSDNEGLPRLLGYALTRICESFGEANLYIGDDGRVYF